MTKIFNLRNQLLHFGPRIPIDSNKLYFISQNPLKESRTDIIKMAVNFFSKTYCIVSCSIFKDCLDLDFHDMTSQILSILIDFIQDCAIHCILLWIVFQVICTLICDSASYMASIETVHKEKIHPSNMTHCFARIQRAGFRHTC